MFITGGRSKWWSVGAGRMHITWGRLLWLEHTRKKVHRAQLLLPHLRIECVDLVGRELGSCRGPHACQPSEPSSSTASACCRVPRPRPCHSSCPCVPCRGCAPSAGPGSRRGGQGRVGRAPIGRHAHAASHLAHALQHGGGMAQATGHAHAAGSHHGSGAADPAHLHATPVAAQRPAHARLRAVV